MNNRIKRKKKMRRAVKIIEQECAGENTATRVTPHTFGLVGAAGVESVAFPHF